MGWKIKNYIQKRGNNFIAEIRGEDKKHISQAEKLAGTAIDPFIGTLEAVAGILTVTAGVAGAGACGAAYAITLGNAGAKGVSLSAEATKHGAKMVVRGTTSALSAPFRAPYHGYKAYKHSKRFDVIGKDSSQRKVIGGNSKNTGLLPSENFLDSAKTVSIYDSQRMTIDKNLQNMSNLSDEQLSELNKQFNKLSKEKQSVFLDSLNKKDENRSQASESTTISEKTEASQSSVIPHEELLHNNTQSLDFDIEEGLPCSTLSESKSQSSESSQSKEKAGSSSSYSAFLSSRDPKPLERGFLLKMVQAHENKPENGLNL